MKEEKLKAAVAEILNTAMANNEKLLKVVKDLIGGEKSTASKGRLTLTNTQTSEERVIAVHYDSYRLLIGQLEQPLQDLWDIKPIFSPEQVVIASTEWAITLQTEHYYRVENNLPIEEAQR